MRKFLTHLVPILFILIGIGLLSYPWISEYIYQNRVDSELKTYMATTADTEDEEKERMLEEAREYNDELTTAQVQITDPFNADILTSDEQDYYHILSLNDDGLMGYVEITKISVYLPIYHGTTSTTLESGVGHLEQTSLPIGGESTHCVLSAHTGLNSSKMFTDLVDMEEGDLFFLHVLDDIYAYRVITIQVVDPSDTSSLVIQNGRDLCTLVTCTPYGVNSHRLLVTGERTEYTEEVYDEALDETTSTESQWMQAYRQAIIMGIVLVCILVLFAIMASKMMNKNKVEEGKPMNSIFDYLDESPPEPIDYKQKSKKK
jgi:sortase A